MGKKTKFTVLVTLMFLLPFLLLSRHFMAGEGELQKKDTLRYLELRTSAAAGIISDILNLDYSLNRVAASVSSGGVSAVKKGLDAKVKDSPFIYSELALLEPSGKAAARYSAERSLQHPLDYRSSPVFAESKRTGAPAGAVEYGEYTPPALVLAEPLTADGSRYFLAGRLSLAYMGELVRLMGRNSYGNFGLVDAGGRIIADSMSMSIVNPGVKAPPAVLKLMEAADDDGSPTVSGEFPYRGGTLLVSVSAVPGSGWRVYEIMDAASVPARGVSVWVWRVVLSGVALIILFGVFTGMLAARWFQSGRD